jgi:peptidoglycan lytic transglycosylase D
VTRPPTRYIGWTIVLASAVLGGCALGVGADPMQRPAAPVPLERLEVATVMPTLALTVTSRPPLEVRIDEILSSPVLSDPDFESAVGRWIEYWRAANPAFGDYMGRMTAFEPLVDSAIALESLPTSLRYLPFIESGYNPRASSRARAVGLWQFMEDTAEGLGLEVSPLLDQRRDPELSTAAAMAFIGELHAEFGSWFFTLAAYNSGPNRVRRVLARYARGVEPSDSLFWALRARFPRETRDFVPKLISAIVLARDADVATPTDPFRFDRVTVPDATTLDVVARAAAVPQADIERLNPQYVRGMTPPGRPSELRVPEGAGPTFATAYALIPPEERVTFVEHRVAAGETFSHIAVRYGVRVADIQAANPALRPRYLKIGSLVTVPVAPSVRPGAQTGS